MRLTRQTEVAECGLACFTMIAGYHGLDVDLGYNAPSVFPIAARNHAPVADEIGRASWSYTACGEIAAGAPQQPSSPRRFAWDMNHYVVVECVKRGKALIHNPDGRSQWLSMSEVSRHFIGVALELHPSDSFEVGRQRERLHLSLLWQRMTGMKRALAQVLVLRLVLQAFVLASHYYMQLAIDRAVSAIDRDLLAVSALGFALFTLIKVLASWLRSFVLLVAGTTIGTSLASSITRRLLRLPIDWFERRHTGDILSRFQSIGPIQAMLTQGAVAALVDGVMAVLTLALMFWYSTVLACIAVSAFLIYLGVRLVSFSFEREAREAAIVAHGKEQSTLIESLRGITTLRLFGREAMRHALWHTRLTDAVNAEIRTSRIGIWQGSANALVFGLENIVTIWLAIRMVMDGAGFSVGMVFAFMAYKAQFIEKAASLADQDIALKMLSLHLERLSDIALSGEDRGFARATEAETELRGRVELRDVFFRYSPSDPLILENVSLAIEAGEHVAITGPSGGGKSTLVKLLLGFVEPESGVVLADGLSLAQFGLRSFQSQIAAVLQEDNLFAGSLAENIALFDDQADMDRVIAATVAASIHDDIMTMPMRYETLIGDMGSTLSGGQKQRVLLARALYRMPRVLIMDEGTAHLDPDHEKAVNAAIGEMGITRIIIAHGRETIEAAERILMVTGGRLHEVRNEESERKGLAVKTDL